MKRLFLATGAVPCCVAGPRWSGPAAGFSDWAVLLVAGDDHAHSGAPSQVFDNARRDLARAFASIGFSPANMVQFSVDPGQGRAADRHLRHRQCAVGPDRPRQGRLPDLFHLAWHAGRHRHQWRGAGAGQLEQDRQQRLRQAPQRDRDVGLFLRPVRAGAGRAQPHGVHGGAARPHLFGCGESDHYTFFDGCFLQALPATGNFPDLASRTKDCVAKQEQALGVDYPSEPQLSIGNDVMAALRWR